ncbi:hypothetical protein AHAS_Ahas11G0144100 [Arachis hypogaea]
MEFSLKHQVGLMYVILLLPSLCSSQDSFTDSRATYYGSPDCYGNPRGACGFGEYGRTVNDGSVAAVSRLWRNGTGCGACYQARCKLEQYCDEEGTYVVVTDYGEGDRTDFILSPRAYKKLGRNDEAAAELFKYGVVDIEYRRVPCRYEGYNIVFKVHERSKNPEYFAVVILYVNGAYDVTAVQLWQEDCQEWTEMRRVYGAVFDYANPPSGEINLRFQVSGSAGIYWVQSQNAIPSDWTAGAAYDSQDQDNKSIGTTSIQLFTLKDVDVNVTSVSSLCLGTRINEDSCKEAGKTLEFIKGKFVQQKCYFAIFEIVTKSYKLQIDCNF